MSTYKVIGVGEHGKFFDDDAYRSAANYIFDPEKAAYVGGCNVHPRRQRHRRWSRPLWILERPRVKR